MLIVRSLTHSLIKIIRVTVYRYTNFQEHLYCTQKVNTLSDHIMMGHFSGIYLF